MVLVLETVLLTGNSSITLRQELSILFFGGPISHKRDIKKNSVTRLLFVALLMYRDADKSVARPGRKQATATKLLTFASHLKKKIRKLSVQPGIRGSNDLRIGRKMATFQLFFQSGRAKDLSASLYI